VAAIAPVNECALGLTQANDGHDAGQGVPERVAVVRVAVQGADLGHKLAVRSERLGGGDYDLQNS
jgi:hypothetical protein